MSSGESGSVEPGAYAGWAPGQYAAVFRMGILERPRETDFPVVLMVPGHEFESTMPVFVPPEVEYVMRKGVRP